MASRNIITLHLRSHTAKILNKWGDPHRGKKDGIIFLRSNKILGKTVWNEIQFSPYPISLDYKGLDHKVQVRLTYRFGGHKKDARYSVAFIDRPGMNRIDRFIHD
jgi:hypothetical protein